MNTLVVIPARYASKRFPGKPLVSIAGVRMIERMYNLARAGANSARIVIATDDERIQAAAHNFGAEAIMTDARLRNGSERVAAAVLQLGETFDLVVNLQGDAVLTPPWVISRVVEGARDPGIEIVTAASETSTDTRSLMIEAKSGGEVGGTTVVFDQFYNALYFSKAVIPFSRPDSPSGKTWRHIGVYAYRPATLLKLVTLPPGPLETAEQLEQLRALEYGVKIRVVPVDYKGRTHWSVDSPEDVRRCEKIIQAEGELLMDGIK